jgi:hypothetical protein
MKALYFGLALVLGVVGLSSTSFSADDGKSTRSRIKRKPAPKSSASSKPQNNEGLKTIEKHAMEVESRHEEEEGKKFEHLLHVFESYIQHLSGNDFSGDDFKPLHDAFHALTPEQKEMFLKQFSEEKVVAHIIEKLKLLYQQFPKPHNS